LKKATDSMNHKLADSAHIFLIPVKEPLKIQSSPKCKARQKIRRAAYVVYVSKKFFQQRSSWDEMWIFRGFFYSDIGSLA
jgi:hypothetical protein